MKSRSYVSTKANSTICSLEQKHAMPNCIKTVSFYEEKSVLPTKQRIGAHHRSRKIKVNSDNAKPALLEVATLVELGYELLLHLRKSLVMSFM